MIRPRPAFFVSVLSLVSGMALTACQSMPGQFAPVNIGETYPPRTPPEKIEIYRSEIPKRAYLEIGTANACCSSDVNYMVDRMRQSAADNGGDAMIGLEVDATGGAYATVIRYK